MTRSPGAGYFSGLAVAASSEGIQPRFTSTAAPPTPPALSGTSGVTTSTPGSPLRARPMRRNWCVSSKRPRTVQRPKRRASGPLRERPVGRGEVGRRGGERGPRRAFSASFSCRRAICQMPSRTHTAATTIPIATPAAVGSRFMTAP